MSADHLLIVKPPKDFSEPEIQDFIVLVLTGDEVGNEVLEQNVRNAKCLGVGRRSSCLVGVAALKSPLSSYRQNIKSKTGVALNAEEFPFELGYVFVYPAPDSKASR